MWKSGYSAITIVFIDNKRICVWIKTSPFFSFYAVSLPYYTFSPILLSLSFLFLLHIMAFAFLFSPSVFLLLISVPSFLFFVPSFSPFLLSFSLSRSFIPAFTQSLFLFPLFSHTPFSIFLYFSVFFYLKPPSSNLAYLLSPTPS